MSKLTIVYLTDPSLDWGRVNAFKEELATSPYDVIELPKGKKSLQEARIQGYKAVRSEFVMFAEPEDDLDLEVVAEALQKLQGDDEMVMCAIRSDVLYTAPTGQQRRSHSYDDLDSRIHISPMNLRGGNMYRTQVVLESLPKLHGNTYFLFDWALRLVVSNMGKIGLTDTVGCTKHVCSKTLRRREVCPRGQVPPRNTVKTLIQTGAYELYCPVRRKSMESQG